MNSNMVTNKNVFKIYQSISVLLWQFIEVVLVTFVAIVFVFFVDTMPITGIISSHSITELSAILFKYLLYHK